MYKIVLVKYGIFLQETHKAHLFFYKKLIFLMKRILLIVKKKVVYFEPLYFIWEILHPKMKIA